MKHKKTQYLSDQSLEGYVLDHNKTATSRIDMKKLITMTASTDLNAQVRMTIHVKSPIINGDEIEITVDRRDIYQEDFKGYAKMLVTFGGFSSEEAGLHYLNHLAQIDENGDTYCELYVVDLPTWEGLISIKFSESEATQSAYEKAQEWIEKRVAENPRAREIELDGVN